MVSISLKLGNFGENVARRNDLQNQPLIRSLVLAFLFIFLLAGISLFGFGSDTTSYLFCLIMTRGGGYHSQDIFVDNPTTTGSFRKNGISKNPSAQD